LAKSQSRNRNKIYTNSNINQTKRVYSSSPIVKGYFPAYRTYKELAIAKFNFGLSICVFALMLIAGIAYYFVVTNEAKLNLLRKDVMHNIDLIDLTFDFIDRN